MVNSIKYTIAAIGFIFLNLICLSTFGQEDRLTKEVQVVRPYEPSISDAFKLNHLPLVEDTIRVAPTFTYNLTARPVSLDLPINPIPPARLVAEPLQRINRGYVKGGFGNYSAPLAEIYFSNERNKEYSYGAWFKHRSSFGNIKLDDSEKVDGSFQRNEFGAFGKFIFNKSVVSATTNFKRFGYGFYGHDTNLNANPAPTSPDEQWQQNFNLNLAYYSTHSDSTHLNYNLQSNFINFTDKFNMQHNTLRFKSEFDKYFKLEKFGGTLEIVHHINNNNLDYGDNTLASIAPWVGLFGDQWRVKAGINAFFDINEFESQSHFYPIGQISYDIVSNYVIPYFQFSGYLEDNNYGKILTENPWVNPGLKVWNTSHKFIMQGGVKGNISPRVAYNLSASFSLIDSAYFFVNRPNVTDGYLENQFIVEYDNIRKRNLTGELTIAPNNSLKFFVQGEFNNYTMSYLDKPWHRPEYKGRVAANYSIQNKIVLKANFYFEGGRYIQQVDGTSKEIEGIADINLGVEYRYTSRISAFINANNLTGNRYHVWHLYPVQQFNMMLGLTYAF